MRFSAGGQSEVEKGRPPAVIDQPASIGYQRDDPKGGVTGEDRESRPALMFSAGEDRRLCDAAGQDGTHPRGRPFTLFAAMLAATPVPQTMILRCALPLFTSSQSAAAISGKPTGSGVNEAQSLTECPHDLRISITGPFIGKPA
jgi:hypothetical protein